MTKQSSHLEWTQLPHLHLLKYHLGTMAWLWCCLLNFAPLPVQRMNCHCFFRDSAPIDFAFDPIEAHRDTAALIIWRVHAQPSRHSLVSLLLSVAFMLHFCPMAASAVVPCNPSHAITCFVLLTYSVHGGSKWFLTCDQHHRHVCFSSPAKPCMSVLK